LKALATSKYVSVNEKFAPAYKIPFYGKIILTSNNEDKFAKVDPEEIRFFVRKLGKPKFENHNIEENLVEEIPAFLDYLYNLPPVDWSVSRSGFTVKELKNAALDKVVKESRSALYKDLEIYISDYFDERIEEGTDSFFASAQDIKQKWFHNNSRIEVSYLRRVLKEEMELEPCETSIRYTPFEDKETWHNSKTGRPYMFTKNVTK
jgi:hypothetical protein